MIVVFLENINRMYITSKDKSKMPGVQHEPSLEKDANYYEGQIGKILTKKFPILSKLFIRVGVILSDMLILTILIVQSMILAFQSPNLMYWLFLILSLVLQAVVVSNQYGYGKPKSKEQLEKSKSQMIKLSRKEELEKRAIDKKTELEEELGRVNKFVIYSRLLRQYSGLVLIIQIAYFFVHDKEFLEKNNFEFGKDLAEYITEHGLEIYLSMAGFTTFASGK